MPLKHVIASIVASVGFSLAPIGPAARASAPSGDQQQSSNFTVYWGVRMFGEVAPGVRGRDWQADLSFEGAPISRDLIFLTQFRVGYFPRPGIHMFELDPSLWDRHWAKLRRDLDRYVPEDFTGIVVIDYERWRPTWERTRNIYNPEAPIKAEDFDFLYDWRDAIRQTRAATYWSTPVEDRLQLIYDTYDEMALRFYVETIRECKRLRPNAKWTYFNFPKLRYYSDETPNGVIGYGDLSHRASRINDKIQALFDEMDVVVPSIYPQRWTVVGNNFRSDLPLNKQNRDRGNAAFISSNVAEAVRLAHGKPVLPIISCRYYMRWPELLWLNDLNIRQAITVSRDAGASGLILWDGIGTVAEWQGLQQMVSERLAPAILELVGQSNTSGSDVADNASHDKSSSGGSVLSSVLTVSGN